MEISKLIEENAINIAIQKIALEINDKMKQYEETKDKKVQSELIQLIKDRDLVYSNDKSVIKKYVRIEE